MSDRITREVTPYVEVLKATRSERSRLLCKFGDSGAVYEEDGRVVLNWQGPRGRPKRILLDPDADIYSMVIGLDPEQLNRSFETHMDSLPPKLLPHELYGRTLVVPHDGVLAPEDANANFAVQVDLQAHHAPNNAAEIHIELGRQTKIPDSWPETEAPICAVVKLVDQASTDILPELLHAMGSGRAPLREVRLRIDPRVFKVQNRRPPFYSEVVELLSSALGCSTVALNREIALRRRLLPLGLRRHLMPDPYFVTWVFRGDKSHGLVGATDSFPIPRRASRKEILRGTPESDRQRLQAYLTLLQDTQPRLRALAERDFFAVSVHYMMNPDLPMFPNHGGITQWSGEELKPLE